MNQKKLSVWLKAIITGVGVCGLIVCFVILPSLGESFRDKYPEFAGWYWPWLGFLWACALPCFAALVPGWRLAANIGKDRSFCTENANMLLFVARLAAGDTLFFFAGNVALGLLSMNHAGIMLLSLLICFAGTALTVAAACPSHLVRKAAALQDENDLTV